jgi:hypothetical protein
MAATRAEDFANAAFVLRDTVRAYGLISEELRAHLPSEQFRDLVSKMHPSNYPLSLEATEFEPIPGQKTMYIFLTGRNGTETFYYRLLMEGVKETNYQVSGLWRGSGPYPPSGIRKSLK